MCCMVVALWSRSVYLFTGVNIDKHVNNPQNCYLLEKVNIAAIALMPSSLSTHNVSASFFVNSYGAPPILCANLKKVKENLKFEGYCSEPDSAVGLACSDIYCILICIRQCSDRSKDTGCC